ncbi:unnamed protein product [Microthlaspi erraticum]|uniref:Uncharacterized protein n=1 Tax=Microthlaspi erraticum TaxID=1685480 RepID=A0A6D2HFI6_9BRAS|nr:unnamed protein product [Microthlaspi erraticum]
MVYARCCEKGMLWFEKIVKRMRDKLKKKEVKKPEVKKKNEVVVVAVARKAPKSKKAKKNAKKTRKAQKMKERKQDEALKNIMKKASAASAPNYGEHNQCIGLR